MKKIIVLLLSLFMCLSLAACAKKVETTTVEGSADGYGGTITAKVTLEGDKIVGLELTGENETPAIGGEALKTLQDEIVKAGTYEVDGVAGATWTSTGVFNAIKNALGLNDAVDGDSDKDVVSASGLKQGLGVVSTPRLGPGKDEAGNPVYSFNEVVAYVLTDAEGKIVDLECDILEIITPNHDGQHDNFIAGWIGQTYAYDEAHDGTNITELTETEETWTSEVSNWNTKRQLGSNYKMNSGTWEQEMDIYEEFFKGMTKDEVLAAEANLFSDVNGRPLNGKSDKEADVTKAAALTDEQKAQIDSLAGATMSVNDAHGNIIAAIVKAMDNQEAITSDAQIANIGLGVEAVYRLGPGKDDQEVPVYSINVTFAGVALDAEDKIVEATCDILEIITPNHGGAHDNIFTGWPGSSYNIDLDYDEKVDDVALQDEESFVAQILAFNTKRDLGSNYKMNSGTWAQEMDIYEEFFKGKSAAELKEIEATLFSDVNGRPLNGKSTKDEDVKKAEGLTADQKAVIDSFAGATMSVNDAHGNIMSALYLAISNAK